MASMDFQNEMAVLLHFSSGVGIAIRQLSVHTSKRILSDDESADLRCYSTALHELSLVSEAAIIARTDIARAVKLLEQQLNIFLGYAQSDTCCAAFKRAEHFNVRIAAATLALNSMHEKSVKAMVGEAGYNNENTFTTSSSIH